MKLCAPTKNRIGQLFKNIITATWNFVAERELPRNLFSKEGIQFFNFHLFAIRWGDITKLFKNFNQN